MQAHFQKYILNFKFPAGTSRGVLHTKETYFIEIQHDGKKGVGECNLFKGLSIDDVPEYETRLQWVCDNINLDKDELFKTISTFPSIVFGLEQAYQNLEFNKEFMYFPSEFTEGKKSIPINGLVWMGDFEFMKKQIIQKIEAGFSTIKLKVGALDFDLELQLLAFIRKEFSKHNLSIRLDANGAFSNENAIEKLKQLSEYQIHSVEQPIKQGNWEMMSKLCEKSPIPIALDEELIGIFQNKLNLLKQISPQYIILKPALHGGFAGCDEWIGLAEQQNIGWWMTSALESNVGLNAIAQYTALFDNPLPQGLGTGGLYTNNFESPLFIKNGTINFYQNSPIKLL